MTGRPTPEAERWRRVQEIFFEAAARRDADRRDFLVAACGGDLELQAEVEALLAADAGAALLDASLDDLALLLDHDETERIDPVPADGRAGPYRIVGELGRGGMGVVYRAERDDDQYAREVALKVVGAPGVDRDELARRFARERQILGRLEHPNIARLYDAGVGSDGESWLAMELVHGQPIDTWCDARALDIDARLEVFEKVVAAVDYAHRNLVVHRDLKPSNILVTTEGSVKLLDFGIAKLLADDVDGDDSGPMTEPVTRVHQRVLTPEYASPEQLDGRPVTTASDVYALGVLLHELLTGRRPDVNPDTRDLTTRPSASVTDRPSDAGVSGKGSIEAAQLRSTTPAQLRRSLEGDLDTLVRAALRAEPELRFPSAAALLDDLVRYREGLPLKVRPPSAAYLTRKFLARHRLAVAAATVAVFALAAGAGVSWRQARIAEAERDVARSVSAFLEGVFVAANPYGGDERLDTMRVGTILERAAERLDTALADQPEVRARMLRILGTAHEGAGAVDRARSLFEDAIRAYAALGRDTDVEVQRARVGLGRVELAAGDPAASVQSFTQALRLAEQRFGTDSHEAAEIRLELAGPLLNLDRLDEAAGELERGLAIVRGRAGAVGSEAGENTPPAEVARHLNLLGALQYRQGRVDEAIETMEEALDQTRAVWGPDHPQSAILGQNLGLALHRAGRSAEAEPIVRESVDRLAAALGPDHPLLGPAMKTLANAIQAQDRWDEAEPLYRRALAHARRTQGEGSAHVGNAAHDLGMALMARDQFGEAEVLLTEALGIEQSVGGAISAGAGIVGTTLARLRLRMGDPATAEAGYREALAALESAFPMEHPRVLQARGGLAVARAEQGAHSEAVALLEAVWSTATTLDDGGTSARSAAEQLAEVWTLAGNAEEAERWRREAQGAG